MGKYKLYWHPKAASYAPHVLLDVLLEEVGVAYELDFVDMAARQHKSELYLKLNPNGKVPTLQLADGRIIFESAGMMIYLADRYPAVGLAPAFDDPLRPLYYQWLFYMASEIYKIYGRCYSPQRFSSDPIAAAQIREQAFVDLAIRWKTLDDALCEGPWLLGDHFSTCDIYMQMMTLWHIPHQLQDPDGPPLPTDAFFDQFKHVRRAVTTIAERSVVKKIMAFYPPAGFAESKT